MDLLWRRLKLLAMTEEEEKSEPSISVFEKSTHHRVNP
jgi:hypothetical protein